MKPSLKIKLLSVLLFLNYFEAIFSCSIERVVKDAVGKINDGVIKRFPRSDSPEEDASEMFGGISDRDLIYNMFNTFNPPPPVVAKTSTSTQTTTVTTTVTPTRTRTVTKDLLKEEIDAEYDPKNCSCKPSNKRNATNQDFKMSDRESYQGNDRNMYIIEKEPEEVKLNVTKNDNREETESEGTKDEEEIDGSTEKKPPTHTTTRPIYTNTLQKARHDMQYDIKEIDEQIDNAIRELCPNYIEVPDLDVQHMADVWQLAYYKADELLSCFKIFIKRTSPQGRRRYEEKYSSFNDTISWPDCLLELVSTGKLRDDKKHYLQATKSDKGILDNIIISVRDDKDNKIITLQEQTPDQWLVTQNLLLMRDCGTGDVVIFTRVPSRPTWDEVERAMHLFGESEHSINGTEPCEFRKDDSTDGDVFKYKKYQLS